MKKQWLIIMVTLAMLTVSISLSAQQPGSIGSTPAQGMPSPNTTLGTPGVINPNSPANPNLNQTPGNTPGSPGYYSSPNVRPTGTPGNNGVPGATGNVAPNSPTNNGISGSTGIPNNINTPGATGGTGPYRRP